MSIIDRMRNETVAAVHERNTQVYLVVTHTNRTEDPDAIAVFGDYGTARAFFMASERIHDNSADHIRDDGYTCGPVCGGDGFAHGLRRWTDRDGNYTELRLSSVFAIRDGGTAEAGE